MTTLTGALERLAAGESVEQIVKGYRGRISKEAIIDAVRLVADQFIKTLPKLETSLELLTGKEAQR